MIKQLLLAAWLAVSAGPNKEILAWSEFKDIVAQQSLGMRYLDRGTFYEIFATDGAIYLETSISKTSPAGADQADFEATYKAAANKESGVRTIAFAATTHRFSADASSGTATCAAPCSTNIDYKFTGARSINGGTLYVDSPNLGDWIEFKIVDVDNVLGYGAGFVLSTFVYKWFVILGQPMVLDLPLRSDILSGLYVRCVYHKVGAATPTAYINYNLYLKL